MSEQTWRILATADDVTPEIERDIESCVDWFASSPTMGTVEFIDQLCKTYGGSGDEPGAYDLEAYDNEAARKIMRIARRIRKETRE
jgi:hypothetical protein